MTLPALLRAPVDITQGNLTDALTVIGHARTAATAMERADLVLSSLAANLMAAVDEVRGLHASPCVYKNRYARRRVARAEKALLGALRDAENAMRQLGATDDASAGL